MRDYKLPIEHEKPLIEKKIDDRNHHHLLRMRNHYARNRNHHSRLLISFSESVKSATTCQRSAFWWDSQNKMAEQLSSEVDLTDRPEFLDSLGCIIERTASVYHASDLVG